jgi:hypothetical protein
MAKQLIIDTRVNTEQVDKAVQKLGQLKDLGRGLSIQYDVDGKPLDIVIDKSKNLQQQFKLVTAELKRTKEGTAEFALLSTKLGDIQDGLARTKAKSGDLFTSLQLLPGPVGEFASKLNGGIALLKTFSSFSLKDLRFQLGETVGDLKDIVSGFLGLNNITKESADEIKNVAAANQQNSSTVEKSTQILNGNTTAAGANTAATLRNGKALDDFISRMAISSDEINLNAKNIDQLATKQNAYIQTIPQMVNGVEKQIVGVRENGKAFRALEASELAAVQSGKDLTITSNGLIKSMYGATLAGRALGGAMEFVGIGFNAATVAVGLFEAALAAIGIGLIIAALVSFGGVLVDAAKKLRFWKTDAEIAAAENDRLATSFKLLAKSIAGAQDALQTQTELLTLQAKIAGKTEEELYQIALDGYNKRVQANKEGRKRIEAEILSLSVNSKITEEERLKKLKELEEEYVKVGEKTNELTIEGKKLVLTEQLRIANKTREGLKKTGDQIVADSKKVQEKIAADTVKANDLLLKLQQENAVNKLKTERERQDEQLKIDRQNEEQEISKLFQIEGKKTKLTVEQEKIKANLLEQIKIKYNLKVDQIDTKRQEEDDKKFEDDEKKLKEYQDKIFEIKNNANSNELGRAKAARLKEFEDAQSALLQDINFQKESVEEKIRILTALEKAYKDDIQKLNDDDAQKNRDKNIKRLQDELKLLQIKGEALREGTKSFFDNQRAILKAAEKQELADLEDRGIKEKLTIEQIEKEKLAIKQKYLKAAKDISNQELEQILAAAQATLGVAQSIAQDVGKVASLGQQVALEEANLRYIEQNELDKKTIKNKLDLEKKLLDNQKKFAIEEDGIKKRAFEENKKIQIAQAIIATLQSAVGAFSSLIATPFIGPVIAPVAAAAALTFGYLQVEQIRKTQYQSSLRLSESQKLPDNLSGTNYGENYEKGGMIGGRRHAEGGTLIEAEKGEAIMTRGAVSLFGPMLSMMNQAGGGTSFNSNLLTTRQDKPILNNPAQEQSPMILKTYVVSNELTTEANKQARLKNLSTI